MLFNVGILPSRLFHIGNGHMSPLLHLLGASSATAVDTATVELHATTEPYGLVDSYKGVVQSDGILLCDFASAADGNYYIVVKHRNSIDSWSAVASVSSNGSYDFTSGATQSYGTNGSTVRLGNGVYGNYSGDINGDKNH